MKREKQRKEYLSIRQIQELKQQIEANKALIEHQEIVFKEMPPVLRGIIKYDPTEASINARKSVVASLEAKNKRLQHILDTQSPQRTTGRDRAKLDAEIARLEEIVRSREPSRRFVMAKGGTPECAEAIQIGYKNATDGAYMQVRERLKYLYRLRDPDDPTLSNLERLRPE